MIKKLCVENAHHPQHVWA